MNQQTLKWSELDETAWDEMPAKTVVQKASPYDALIQEVIDGSIIAIPVDEKELRGTRIGISRRASKAFGVKLIYRYDDNKNVLAIKLDTKSSSDDSPEPRKPGRPPKKA